MVAEKLGAQLRAVFASTGEQPLPAAFRALLDQLPEDEAPNRGPLPDAEFKKDLAALIPHLRAFGRSLSGNRDLADDLVQETMMKAWAARSRFEAGTNMKAWCFIILRNIFLSEMRRSRFKGEWNEVVAERTLVARGGQEGNVALADAQRALLQLPQSQREAIILVGAGGFAYEEAASICGVAVGTIKSRVARGRSALEALFAGGNMPSRRADPADALSPLDGLMKQVEAITG